MFASIVSIVPYRRVLWRLAFHYHLSGAADPEIKEASLVARDRAFMASIDYDIVQFKRELQQIAEHMQKAGARAA